MKKPLIIHPFLFAIFPVLFLFSHNRLQTTIDLLLAPLAVVLIFASLWFLVLSVIFKNKIKTAIVVSLSLILLFSYGHFHNLFFNLVAMVGKVHPGRIVFPLWGIIFIMSVLFIIRTRKNLYALTKVLNAAAAFMVILQIAVVGIAELKTKSGDTDYLRKNITGLKNVKSLPNIYYIILDGYGREDILRELYQYDNKEFLDYLREKGFYVADKSASNYCQTSLSLSSSLNYKYLDDLAAKLGPDSKNRRPLLKMIKNNNVVRFLKQYGYLVVAFSSGYTFTEMDNADIYKSSKWRLNEFQSMLLNTTPIPALARELLPGKALYIYERKRRMVLYTLNHLADTTKINYPVFVFAHVEAAHPPFVFGEDGRPINPDQTFTRADGSDYIEGERRGKYIEGYNGQLTFVNKKMKMVIDDIISNSKTPPVIILQSDHGPSSMVDLTDPEKSNLKERMSIFNAIYLPGDGKTGLYEEITPVNTFRIIFNYYFGADYRLLKDESYFSTLQQPYKFINVSDKVK